MKKQAKQKLIGILLSKMIMKMTSFLNFLPVSPKDGQKYMKLNKEKIIDQKIKQMK